MANKIVKKILPEYFDLIASGKKKFEIRVADFEANEGDTLVLEEWDSLDHATRKPTGRTIEKTITYATEFDLNQFNQQEEIEKHGIRVMQFE